MSHELGYPSVVVVGAGPAGIAASQVMLDHGLHVTLLDEAPSPGGQYFKEYRAAPTLSRGRQLDSQRQDGDAARSGLRGDELSVHTNALCWGIFPGNEVASYADGRVSVLHPDAIVLATGAIERVAAFPGWTLPGVMTAGGVQALLSREGILPGKRFLVAGTGPLLLAIASEIAEAGGEVVAVVEGSAVSAPLRHIRQFLHQMRRVHQAIDYRRALRQRNIPVHSGQAVVAATGDEEVAEAVVARLDADWCPVAGDETRYQVDTLCLHYGFIPSTELARMAGCDVSYDASRGGWFAVHDPDMRMTQPGIYGAGQVAGIGGADLAAASGHLAGLTVARDLALLTPDAYAKLTSPVRRQIDRGREFASVLNAIYTPRVGITEMITQETIVCRCEEVVASEVAAAVDEGAVALNDVKRRTRCGMGLCQGRICSPVVTDYLRHRTGADVGDIGLITARPPIKPIPLSAVADLEMVT